MNPFKETDAELVQKCKDNNQVAWFTLFRRYEKEAFENIFYVIYSVTDSYDTTDDIVQDAFIKTFKSISRIRNIQSFEAWFGYILKSVKLDFFRQNPLGITNMPSRLPINISQKSKILHLYFIEQVPLCNIPEYIECEYKYVCAYIDEIRHGKGLNPHLLDTLRLEAEEEDYDENKHYLDVPYPTGQPIPQKTDVFKANWRFLDKIIFEEENKRIHNAINELNNDQRCVSYARFCEEKTYREISKDLGIAEKTVKSRLHYARENLKKI